MNIIKISPLLLLLLVSCYHTATKSEVLKPCANPSSGEDAHRWFYLTSEGEVFRGQYQIGTSSSEQQLKKIDMLTTKHDGILVVEAIGTNNWIEYSQYRKGQKDGERIRLKAGRIIKRRLYDKGSLKNATWWYDNGGLWCNIMSNTAGIRDTVWDTEGNIYSDGVYIGTKRHGTFSEWIYGGQTPVINVYSNGNFIQAYTPSNAVFPPLGE